MRVQCTCRTCGAAFDQWSNEVARGRGIYCSKACQNGDSVSLFWAKVGRAAPSGCWVWTGATNPSGYGQITRRGHRIAAHRFSYELSHGPVPPSLDVLHHCDNPPCVNPAHLFLGTHSDNMLDMARKRRRVWVSPRGTQNSMARLTDDDVRAIRLGYETGQEYMSEIARRFGVSKTTISRLIQRRTWSHVP